MPLEGLPSTLVTVATITSQTYSDGSVAAYPVATQPALETSAGRPHLEPAEGGFGDWDRVLTIFLLTWVTAAWALASVLYFTTFPEKVAWLDGLLARWKLKRRAHRNRPSRFHTGENRVNSAQHSNSSERASTAVATGLGLSMNSPPNTPRLRKPRSFDLESLKSRVSKPHINLVSTAPLPSSRSFTALSPLRLSTYKHTRSDQFGKDLEYGVREEAGLRTEARDLEECTEAGRIADVLESVNAVIGFVAEHLASMTSDRVTDGAEGGLMLPVRNEEREWRA